MSAPQILCFFVFVLALISFPARAAERLKATTETYSLGSIDVIEVHEPYLVDENGRARFFDDQTVIFDGVDKKEYDKQNNKMKNSPLVQFIGPDIKNTIVFDIYKNDINSVSQGNVRFCFNKKYNILIASGWINRNEKIPYIISDNRSDIFDEKKYLDYRELKLEKQNENKFWHQESCSYLPKSQFSNAGVLKSVLANLDGVLIGGMPTHQPPVLFDLDGNLVRTFPIEGRRFSGATVRFSNWRGLYFQFDSFNKQGLWIRDPASGSHTRFRDMWRESNCLRFWWFDAVGRFEEECVPYVPDGTQIYPMRHGKLIISTESGLLEDLGASGVYWAANDTSHPVFLFPALASEMSNRGDVSPDGCKAAIPTWRPDSAAKPPMLLRLTIVKTC